MHYLCEGEVCHILLLPIKEEIHRTAFSKILTEIPNAERAGKMVEINTL
jgi:hypothetical protein